jgi:hypothetical protein
MSAPTTDVEIYQVDTASLPEAVRTEWEGFVVPMRRRRAVVWPEFLFVRLDVDDDEPRIVFCADLDDTGKAEVGDKSVIGESFMVINWSDGCYQSARHLLRLVGRKWSQ